MSIEYPQRPILVIDDEDIVQKYTGRVLVKGGIGNLIQCRDPREVMALLEKTEVSLILLDLIMPWMSGEELLKEIHEECPEIPVIVVTSSKDVQTAVRCMKTGAVDFMIKRVEENRLISGVRKALEMRALRDENISLKRTLSSRRPVPKAISERLISRNEKMFDIFARIECMAPGDQTILVTGETGTGKELTVEAIHDLSLRPGKLVTVNVAGINDDMFADTLFGHARGSYTSAYDQRSGLIERAAGGTLFLDEIGDLSSASQIKLLRVLENREYYPIGSDLPKISSARIITATNTPLDEEVDNGGFRKDLYFRLSMNEIRIPPLRDRRDDIPVLVRYFLSHHARRNRIVNPDLPAELLRLLASYSFPGNVRELKALILNAVDLRKDGKFPMEPIYDYLGKRKDWIKPEISLQADNSEPCEAIPDIAFGPSLPTIRRATEKLVLEALERSGGNQSRAAELLGITQQALSNRLRRSGLQQKL